MLVRSPLAFGFTSTTVRGSSAVSLSACVTIQREVSPAAMSVSASPGSRRIVET